ncbi:permease family-domain-containing protein [Gigaspora rosea]|uniref:Permease family-domain-containing protein n=1 Tax=Gigaspora rosea TaxID=44941 RepID=A0A397VYE5_9GLOM|nr:permease family-domain-containing protein [Gigaspora rosea]
MFDKLNNAVASSFIGRYFKLGNSGVPNARSTNFTTELRAGLATFVTMAYIISVNALILSDTGGPCVCNSNTGDLCVNDPDYIACKTIVQRDLITGTAAISCIATAIMGIFANLPLALAPGMGMNAYFTYTVVGFHGSGKIAYETAIAAVFVEGLIFIFLSIIGIRQWMTKLIPTSIKIAIGAGVGFFLTFIGLQRSAGIALISHDPSTIVTLGGCPEQYYNATTGICNGHNMESPTTWLGILGFLIIVTLLLFRVKGSMFLGILFISIVSWFRNSQVTYFPYTEEGNARFDFFKKVVSFHPMEKTLGAMRFDIGTSDVWVALITFLYLDILDTTGTLYSMAKFSGFLDEHGDFEGSTAAFICDALSISIGSIFGTSPVTTFIESGSGITEGGRTGISSLTVSFFFFISLFFAPIFASIPPWASGPALVVIGAMMAKGIKEINWEYIGDAVPSFLTIAIMPLTYNVAYGLIAGIGSYIVINTFVWLIEKLSFGRISLDKSKKDPWGNFSFGPGGEGLAPPWFVPVVYKIRGIERTEKIKESIEIKDVKEQTEINHDVAVDVDGKTE